MNIKDSDIAHKKIAGETKDGEPLVYVQSHGGLHAIFKRADDGSVKTIAAAPHCGIMRWLADKAEPGIKWNDDFSKSEDLNKSEDDRFERLRNIVFAPVQSNPIQNPGDLCLVYDVQPKLIQVMSKAELLSAWASTTKSLPPSALIKDLAMDQPVIMLADFIEKEFG